MFRVTAFVNCLPPRISSWLRLMTLIAATGFSVILTKSSYDLLAFSFKLHLASASWLGVPLQGPHMSLAIGFTVLALFFAVTVAKAVINVKSGKSIDY